MKYEKIIREIAKKHNTTKKRLIRKSVSRLKIRE